MAAIEREPTRYAHGDGHADLAIDPTVSEYPGQFITCGGDGEVRIWNGLEDDSPIAISLADVCRGLASRSLPSLSSDSSSSSDAAAQGRFVAGSADTHGVHAYDLPNGTPTGILTRFTADVNCLSYSPDGLLLAAGGGDFVVKILRDSGSESDTPAVAATFTGHSAPILSLAFDPSGTRLASAACNGDIKVWDLNGLATSSAEESSIPLSQRCVKTLGGVFPFSNDFDNTQTLCRLTWSPDGSSLLVPAVGGVKSFNTDSWDFQFTFTEESLTVANVCRFSPCGKFFAVASTNGYLIIFDYVNRCSVAKSETDKKVTICSMIWNPTVPAGKPSELIICDVEGNLGGYKCRLGASKSSGTTTKKPVAKANAENFQGLFDDDDDDGDFAAAAAASQRDDDAADDAGTDFAIPGAEDDAGSRLDGVISRAESSDTLVPAAKVYESSGPKLPVPQDSFQPSATPRHLSNRFMVWNSVGIIVQHKAENAIDIEWHDTAVHHAIHFTNDDNHIMADMNQNLVALASDGGEDDAGQSKLTVLTISSWDSSKQWSVSLPEGEVIEAVAVGANWVAVGTSTRQLRIFSAAGLQREIVSLPGPVVCMSGHESQLLVSVHDGVGVSGDQKLTLLHYRNLGGKPYAFRASRYPLVLSAKAELEWQGFSFEGSPITVDSVGIVRMTKSRFQSQWVQIADTRKNLGKSDHYFIIAVSERDAHLRCIFCKACSYPSVLPKPLVQTIPVAMPVAEPETDKSQAEAAFWSSAALAENEDTVVSMQEQLLKLVALSCKSDRDFRACEVASLFPSAESLQLAIKYASRLKKMNLASKFGEIALRRRQEEEEEALASIRGRGSGMGGEDDNDSEFPPDSQVPLFDDSPPPKPRSASRNRTNGDGEDEEAEEMEEDDESESGPLLQLDKKGSKAFTPLVATASLPQDKKNNGAGNPFRKQMSMDSSSAGAAAEGKNVFAALAKPPPTLLKKASSFTGSAGGRFSKAAGKKGDDVIKPPPVKRKNAAAGNMAGKKTTASLARSFETQKMSATSASSETSASKADSIVTSTPAAQDNTQDESPFAFWKRCNMDSILADLDETIADDEEAVTQHCVRKFRELPTGERKEWIAKFNTQKQASQLNAGKVAISEQNGNVAAAGADAEETGKKRKLSTDEDEDKEQKPPTVKSKLAAFAFAGGE